MQRRRFIAAAGTAVVATAAAKTTAASYSRIYGANDRLAMALIGSGRRGREVMKAFLTTGRAELRALCDVYDVQRGRAKEALLAAGQSVEESDDIETTLARREIDAVLIASPDHLHLPQAVSALRAGKHVYLEKPTTHDFDEGEKLIGAVRAGGKVLQTGTQQRSGAHYQRAKAEIFGGNKIGQLIFARAVWSDFPWQRRRIAQQPRPAGLDWQRFLGPAKKVPYEWVRYDAWRYFPDYGGGLLADILTHWADVAQWMMDDAAPQSAVAAGGIYQLKDGRVNPDTVSAILQYKGGWNLTFESTVLSVRNERPSVYFEGTEGSLDIARDGYVFRPNKGEPQTVKVTENLEVAHATNFLDAVKNNSRPSAPIEIGVEACRPVHLAKAAFWQKKRMGFSPDGKKIVEAT